MTVLFSFIHITVMLVHLCSITAQWHLVRLFRLDKRADVEAQLHHYRNFSTN